MKRPAKPLLIALAALLCAAHPSFAKGDDGDDAAPEKKSSRHKHAAQMEIDVPIPVGHDATGIKLPLYGADGKLQMTFAIQMARREDDEHLKMGQLRLETFDETGQPAMSVVMSSSVLNLKTHVITSNEKTTVKRADFEITGNHVEFETTTRVGRFFGFTRMLVYNMQ